MGDPIRVRDAPWPVRRGGWVLKLYENFLVLAALSCSSSRQECMPPAEFTFITKSNFRSEKETVNFIGYLQTPAFWFESFQNRQSEFLAIGSMVILSIFLRQRGSPESKPVARGWLRRGRELI